jgi:hypothetical protein
MLEVKKRVKIDSIWDDKYKENEELGLEYLDKIKRKRMNMKNLEDKYKSTS